MNKDDAGRKTIKVKILGLSICRLRWDWADTSRKWTASPLQKARIGLTIFWTGTNCQASWGTLDGSDLTKRVDQNIRHRLRNY